MEHFSWPRETNVSAAKRRYWLQACFALALSGGPASASVVTSIPGGKVIPFPVVNYYGPGPQTFGPGITWTSTNASNEGGSTFGYTGGYGFGANGFWNFDMSGVNDSTDAFGVTDTMTFSFATPVSAVGGFLNYTPGGSTPTTIAVYNSSDTLIESYDLTFLTGGATDTGEFFGFAESTPDIASFTLTDNFIGITNLTTAITPEPSMLLPLVGLLGMLAFGARFAAGSPARADPRAPNSAARRRRTSRDLRRHPTKELAAELAAAGAACALRFARVPQLVTDHGK
jgi:hypothetical protein